MLNVISLFVGILAGLIGGIIVNQALVVAGVVLVCIPFIVKSIDELFIKKWSEATFSCLGIMAFISVCIWTLSLDNTQLEVTDRHVLWIIVISAGIIQLLWKLLVRLR